MNRLTSGGRCGLVGVVVVGQKHQVLTLKNILYGEREHSSASTWVCVCVCVCVKRIK